MVVHTGKLEGHFVGFFGRNTQFYFADGVIWQQTEDKVQLADSFQPNARVIAQQGVCFLEVEGIDEWVQVTRQHLCEDQ